MERIALLLDEEFQRGFKVHGSKHEDGFIGELHWNGECKSQLRKGSQETPTGELFWQDECKSGVKNEGRETPSWQLAQWACKYNILEGKWKENICQTPSQQVALYIEGNETILQLKLHASEEYGMSREAGMDWPHLLIEQHMGERCPTLDKIEKLEFVSEVKVAYCDCCMENPDSSLHAAQANLFLTIHNIENGDMYWFGIPYFDNRFHMQDAYVAEDGGKEDASHKMIYIVPQKRFSTKSFHEYEWITYKRDIYPDIIEGLKLAVEKGYFETDDCSKYRITSMNFGWEMPGTYNADLYIKNLSLIAEKK